MFDNIIAHKKQIEFLVNAFNMGRMSHSYIFEGISGIGKKRLALEFVKLVLGVDFEYDLDNHMDFMLVSAETKNIKNEQIEELQDFLSIKPYTSDYKVAIIDDSFKMTISAQNRILKILEEAPNNILIIFICENSNSMLPTIVSRCQILKFYPISKEQICDYLISKYGIDESLAMVYSEFAEGSLKKCVDILELQDFRTARVKILDLLLAIHTKNRVATIDISDEILNLDINMSEILELMEIYYRDILFILVFELEDNIVNKDCKDQLWHLSRNISKFEIVKYIENVLATKKMLLENVSDIVAFDTLIATLQEDNNGYGGRYTL